MDYPKKRRATSAPLLSQLPCSELGKLIFSLLLSWVWLFLWIQSSGWSSASCDRCRVENLSFTDGFFLGWSTHGNWINQSTTVLLKWQILTNVPQPNCTCLLSVSSFERSCVSETSAQHARGEHSVNYDLLLFFKNILSIPKQLLIFRSPSQTSCVIYERPPKTGVYLVIRNDVQHHHHGDVESGETGEPDNRLRAFVITVLKLGWMKEGGMRFAKFLETRWAIGRFRWKLNFD